MTDMRKTLAVVTLLVLALVPDANAQGAAERVAQTFTIEHYGNVARVSDVRIAPAGDRAVMVVAWPNYVECMGVRSAAGRPAHSGPAHHHSAKERRVATLVAQE